MKLNYVVALAGAFMVSACGVPSTDNDWMADRDTRICRDGKGKRVSDNYCSSRSGGAGWYYIGRGGYVPSVGGTVTQSSYGSTAPRAGASYYTAPKVAPASAVTRGGFGSGARASVSAGG